MIGGAQKSTGHSHGRLRRCFFSWDRMVFAKIRRKCLMTRNSGVPSKRFGDWFVMLVVLGMVSVSGRLKLIGAAIMSLLGYSFKT